MTTPCILSQEDYGHQYSTPILCKVEHLDREQISWKFVTLKSCLIEIQSTPNKDQSIAERTEIFQ